MSNNVKLLHDRLQIGDSQPLRTKHVKLLKVLQDFKAENERLKQTVTSLKAAAASSAQESTHDQSSPTLDDEDVLMYIKKFRSMEKKYKKMKMQFDELRVQYEVSVGNSANTIKAQQGQLRAMEDKLRQIQEQQNSNKAVYETNMHNRNLVDKQAVEIKRQKETIEELTTNVDQLRAALQVANGKLQAQTKHTKSLKDKHGKTLAQREATISDLEEKVRRLNKKLSSKDVASSSSRKRALPAAAGAQRKAQENKLKERIEELENENSRLHTLLERRRRKIDAINRAISTEVDTFPQSNKSRFPDVSKLSRDLDRKSRILQEIAQHTSAVHPRSKNAMKAQPFTFIADKQHKKNRLVS